MYERRAQSRAEKLFCVAFFLFAAYLAFKYAFGIALPFIIGWLLSFVIIPLSRKSEEYTKISRRVWAVLYVALFVSVLCLLLYFAAKRLASELFSLTERLSEPGSEIYVAISSLADELGSVFGGLSLPSAVEDIMSSLGIRESFGEIVSELVKSASTKLAHTVSAAVGSVISGIPAFFIAFFVSLMSCYYFSVDRENIGVELSSLLPSGIRGRIAAFYSLVSSALKRYVRAYILIMSLTFAEVFVGLSILGVRWAFIIALGVAIIDILPVLGTGTVLLPWATFAFVIRNNTLGVGLIILYGVITIVRQLVEPKIIGSSIGIHPLISLASMYVGFRLFGIWGMILGPAAAYVLKEIMSEGRACDDL